MCGSIIERESSGKILNEQEHFTLEADNRFEEK